MKRLLVVAAALTAFGAAAQTFPGTRPIVLVVPFPPAARPTASRATWPWR